MQRKGTEQNIHFWFGTAIHFALEDYHGLNRFGDPRDALDAYYMAFDEDTLPEGADEHYALGQGMLGYYLEWYPKHNKDKDFQTVWFDKDYNEVEPWSEGGKPGTEVKFYLDLGIHVIVDTETEQILGEYTPETGKLIKRLNSLNFLTMEDEETLTYPVGDKYKEVSIVPIHYHGTVDRVVKDRYGKWWIMDYKTAKGADTNKLDTDDQISAYIWAMEQILQHPIEGFIYLQLTKDLIQKPRRLKNGSLSVDKKQKTTYQLVRKEIIEDYGSVQVAPNKVIEFLNHMAEQNFPEGDRFIRWDLVKRSKEQLISTYNHIMGEVRMMINPNLYLFPNPTRDCIWDCPLRDICIALDDGRLDDVNYTLEMEYSKRPREEDGDQEAWMDKIKWPDVKKPVEHENIEHYTELSEFDKTIETYLETLREDNGDE